jgi:predicted Fe-S protein YdhL (DUF1289 family)
MSGAAPVDAPRELPVPSPCISVCRMSEASGLCEGCFRTLDEIARWSGMSEADKREVWNRIEVRMAAAGACRQP